jgi:hypothetical protein
MLIRPLRYGDRFDEQTLKVLPRGSIYSEPGGVSHFALTGAEPVLVEISGFGPTDTHYVDPKDAPTQSKRSALHPLRRDP